MTQMQFAEIEPGRARRTDPITSHEAGRMAQRFAPTHCAAILSALRRFGNAGAEQLAAATKLDPYAVRKRLAEIETSGLARPNGEYRKTITGRRERVWEPT